MRYSLFLSLLLLVASGTAWGVTVETLDGRSLELDRFQIDARGLSATLDGKTLEIPAAELLEVDFGEKAKRPSVENEEQGLRITTTNGEEFSLREFTASKAEVRFRTAFSQEPYALSRNQVDQIRLFNVGAESDADWRTLFDQQDAGDLLILARKSKETGEYTFDSLSGIVERVGEETIDFIWDGEPFPVKRTKVAAIVYYRGKQTASPKTFCILHTRDGSFIPCRRLESFSTSSSIEAESLSGLVLRFAESQIEKLDFSNGKLLFLSDFQPLAQKWTPLVGIAEDNQFLRRAGQPRFNQSFTGSTLQLKNVDPSQEPVSYARGIAMRSRTEIVFEIPTGMQRFQTLAGINPATANQGNVELEFTSKGEPLWRGQIRGEDAPELIEFSLKNVKRLRIFVDYGENLDFGDQLHLVNPRVSQ